MMKYFIELTIEDYYVITIFFKTEKEMWTNVEILNKQIKDYNQQIYVSMFGNIMKNSIEEEMLND